MPNKQGIGREINAKCGVDTNRQIRATQIEKSKSTQNEKLPRSLSHLGPTLTRGEQIKLEAMRFVRAFILYDKLPERKAITRPTRLMSKTMFLDEGGKLWRKTKNGVRVEVLMIHDGMGSPEAAADFIYTHIVTKFGCPLSLQSDHGTHFVNPIIKALCPILRINHHSSTPYYSQSNGKTQRVVGTIKTMLKKTVLEAAIKADKKEEEGDNIFGIGLTIDEEVIEKIREG